MRSKLRTVIVIVLLFVLATQSGSGAMTTWLQGQVKKESGIVIPGSSGTSGFWPKEQVVKTNQFVFSSITPGSAYAPAGSTPSRNIGKLDSRLRDLVNQRGSNGQTTSPNRAVYIRQGILIPGEQTGVGDSVYVYIYVNENTPLVVIDTYVSQIKYRDPEFSYETALVTLNNLPVLSSLPGVKAIILITPPQTGNWKYNV